MIRPMKYLVWFVATFVLLFLLLCSRGHAQTKVQLEVSYKHFVSEAVRAQVRATAGVTLIDETDTPYVLYDEVYVDADKLPAAMKAFKKSHKVYVVRITPEQKIGQ